MSETELNQGSALKTQIDDSINGIIQGRKTMAEWPDAVAEWRRVAGDAIRDEYQAAYDAG